MKYNNRHNDESFFDTQYGMHEHNTHYAGPVAPGFTSRMFGWMFLGLSLSGSVAYLFSPDVNPLLFKKLITGPLWLLAFVQLGIVFFFSARWQTLPFATSSALFLTYSGLNGLLFAPILYMYTGASVVQVFLIAAAMFGTMALYGAVTNYNLDGVGGIVGMALWGLIIAMVVNVFMQSQTTDLVISAFGVILFAVLTAWDVQKFRKLSAYFPNPADRNKLALVGALNLYLDLVNIFIFLLRLMGDRRR